MTEMSNPNDALVSFQALKELNAEPFDMICLQSQRPSELTTTIVQLIPTNDDDEVWTDPCQKREGQDAFKEKKKNVLLRLHPLLYEFLVRALQSMEEQQQDNEEDYNNHDESFNLVSVASVAASEIDQDYPHMSSGWVVQVLPRNVVASSVTSKLNLSLVTICRDLDGTENEEMEYWIRRALEGRVVSDSNTVVVLGDCLFLVKISSDEEHEPFSSSSGSRTYQQIDMDHEISITLDESNLYSRWGDDVDNGRENLESMDDDYCLGYKDLQEHIHSLFQLRGKAAPTGIVLTGCAGVGKTKMASCLTSLAYFKQSGIAIHNISVHDVLLQASWATQADLIQLLLPSRIANVEQRIIVILDDLDVLGNADGDTSQQAHDYELMLTKNAVLATIDRLVQQGAFCNVLGMCRDVGCLPKELLSVGCLEKTVTMMTPTQWQRECILKKLLWQTHPSPLQEEDEVVFEKWALALGPLTSGCVAADLVRLCMDASTHAWARRQRSESSLDDMNDGQGILDPTSPTFYNRIAMPNITWSDLRKAAQSLVPSQLAELDVMKSPPLPDHLVDSNDYRAIHHWSWDHKLGGYDETKKRVYRTVVAPWRHYVSSLGRQRSTDFDGAGNSNGIPMGVAPPAGVLFHGPSGTGKTLAAGCLAVSLGLPFVKVRASQVLDQWLGGSEAAVRSLFARARSAAPCILFFDEIDAIATNRENDDNDVASRLLSTFLNEMDGVSSGNNGVLVVAATNRLDALDAALLRPGRLEEHVLLPLPTETDIVGILELHLRRIPLGDSRESTIRHVAASLAASNASGAQVEGFCRTLCLDATRRCALADSASVAPSSFNQSDIDDALRKWTKT